MIISKSSQRSNQRRSGERSSFGTYINQDRLELSERQQISTNKIINRIGFSAVRRLKMKEFARPKISNTLSFRTAGRIAENHETPPTPLYIRLNENGLSIEDYTQMMSQPLNILEKNYPNSKIAGLLEIVPKPQFIANYNIQENEYNLLLRRYRVEKIYNGPGRVHNCDPIDKSISTPKRIRFSSVKRVTSLSGAQDPVTSASRHSILSLCQLSPRWSDSPRLFMQMPFRFTPSSTSRLTRVALQPTSTPIGIIFVKKALRFRGQKKVEDKKDIDTSKTSLATLLRARFENKVKKGPMERAQLIVERYRLRRNTEKEILR